MHLVSGIRIADNTDNKLKRHSKQKIWHHTGWRFLYTCVILHFTASGFVSTFVVFYPQSVCDITTPKMHYKHLFGIRPPHSANHNR